MSEFDLTVWDRVVMWLRQRHIIAWLSGWRPKPEPELTEEDKARMEVTDALLRSYYTPERVYGLMLKRRPSNGSKED